MLVTVLRYSFYFFEDCVKLFPLFQKVCSLFDLYYANYRFLTGFKKQHSTEIALLKVYNNVLMGFGQGIVLYCFSLTTVQPLIFFNLKLYFVNSPLTLPNVLCGFP